MKGFLPQDTECRHEKIPYEQVKVKSVLTIIAELLHTKLFPKLVNSIDMDQFPADKLSFEELCEAIDSGEYFITDIMNSPIVLMRKKAMEINAAAFHAARADAQRGVNNESSSSSTTTTTSSSSLASSSSASSSGVYHETASGACPSSSVSSPGSGPTSASASTSSTSTSASASSSASLNHQQSSKGGGGVDNKAPINLNLFFTDFFDGISVFNKHWPFWPLLFGLCNVPLPLRGILGVSHFVVTSFNTLASTKTPYNKVLRKGDRVEEWIMQRCCMADLNMLKAGCLMLVYDQLYYVQGGMVFHILDTKALEYLLCIQQCISAIGCQLCLMCPGSSDPKFGSQHFAKQCQL